ncbi:capsular biosynthesis protein [Ensifer sp.]|uniref:capsular polysaccharide export protein, LipB/KpsS family n=1 Tax=Ensifer sp. TaxID=1872086 RepID=UPI00289A59E9|nr:capsular biosynthesis protein [Ensifer sp.]
MSSFDEQDNPDGWAWHPSRQARLGATHFVRRAFPWLGFYFDGVQNRSTLSPRLDGVVSWGGRLPAKAAMTIARVRGLPHWHLEDGFLRSVGLGKDGTRPVSIIVDDLALPTDASSASRLEWLISRAVDADGEGTGERIRQQMIERRLSKYNNLPNVEPHIGRTSRRRILLIDQVYGDVSVEKALGSAASFHQMLDEAVATGAQCVVRPHPDVMAGHRRGYLAERASRIPGVVFMNDRVSVASILEVVDEVWTVSSQMGFDALLREIPVRCYAMPFYAGWGLTEDHVDDRAATARHRRASARPTIGQLTSAALGTYPIYRHPGHWAPMSVFAAMDFLSAEMASG